MAGVAGREDPPDGEYVVVELKGPMLEPPNVQTEYSSTLLEMFRTLVQSPGYVQRLKRHYEMFRATVEENHGRSDSQRRLRGDGCGKGNGSGPHDESGPVMARDPGGFMEQPRTEADCLQ